MLIFSLVFALFAIVVDSRVTFTTSEVLDDVDLAGSMAEASFRCSAGCRVYSPTSNSGIVIVDKNGDVIYSLLDLATLTTGQVYELSETRAPYKLKNKGADSPSFVFYAVEKGAMNYQSKVLYVTPTSSKVRVIPKTDSILTVLSSGGAVRFADFDGDFSGGLPTVYATGFDSINSCSPVYKAVSTTTLLNTYFPVLSPIATIKFNGAGVGTSVAINGDPYASRSTGEDASTAYVSPGYVGCKNVANLYTRLPPITSFSNSFTATDSNGIKVAVNGEYSIANKADALSLTVNNDVQTLFGTAPITKSYDATSFTIAVKWEKKYGSQDRFALQLDVESKVTPPNTKTTKQGSADPTTSSGQEPGLILACLTFAMYFSTR